MHIFHSRWSMLAALLLAAVSPVPSASADEVPPIVKPSAAEPPMVNGCTEAAAEDKRGEAAVTITTNGLSYSPACVRVSPGTVVTINSNFGSGHPMTGGMLVDGTATPDPSSPIPATTAGTSVSFTLDTQGFFGYYCTNHVNLGMKGAVLVGDETVFSDDFESPPEPEVLAIVMPAFADGEAIPLVYAQTFLGGNNTSPQISWNGAPNGTQAYALLMDDETLPCGTGDDACLHWHLHNIPADITSLSAGVSANDLGNTQIAVSYQGPAPPKNSNHTYTFEIFALNKTLPDMETGTFLTRSSFRSTYADAILTSATYHGTFLSE